MRIFETAHDHCVLPGVFLVARIDGRNFTRLTKDIQQFDAPFDERFRDLMVSTTTHLMKVGFNVVFGYTQSDEISLLFDHKETTFGRKLRKFNSVLAGEASAKFSVELGQPAAFDCRISVLPLKTQVVDYFRWRNEDANRNALNGHCYWALRDLGETQKTATAKLSGMSHAEKNELLFTVKNLNYNDVPSWQKRGIGLYFDSQKLQGQDSSQERTQTGTNNGPFIDFNLPMKEKFSRFIDQIVARNLSKYSD